LCPGHIVQTEKTPSNVAGGCGGPTSF
jgi:hypothetical protein